MDLDVSQGVHLGFRKWGESRRQRHRGRDAEGVEGYGDTPPRKVLEFSS